MSLTKERPVQGTAGALQPEARAAACLRVGRRAVSYGCTEKP